MRDSSLTLIDAVRFQREYTRQHSNFNADRHIREAANWLMRAQDAGTDRGVSYGARLGGDFLPSYPETTGYIIPTFLALANQYADPKFRERAIEMGDWEISIQMSCGAVMGGRVDSLPSPAIFNTGQVLLGWTALFSETAESRFLAAARRAAEWMLEMQEPDGNWIHGNSKFARLKATVYNIKAAWGLYRYGMLADDHRAMEGALRNAEYTLSKQQSNGWFADCCLTDPAQPLLHTTAYSMQGLLEIGRLAKRNDLINAARRAADALLTVMKDDGFLPGRMDKDLKPSAGWCCLTGSAQTSIVWSLFHQITGADVYRNAASLVNRYVMGRHDISSRNPAIRGALAGSWPVWGDYGKFQVLNWATKFLIDALLLQKETDALLLQKEITSTVTIRPIDVVERQTT